MHPPPAELGLARTRTMGGLRLTEFAQPPHRRLPWHEHHATSLCFVVSGSYAERLRGGALPPADRRLHPPAPDRAGGPRAGRRERVDLGDRRPLGLLRSESFLAGVSEAHGHDARRLPGDQPTSFSYQDAACVLAPGRRRA